MGDLNISGDIMLDSMKFGPGNRPYWETKEGRTQSRYPDLLRILSKERDPSRRRLLFEFHRRKMGGVIGAPGRQIEPRGAGISRSDGSHSVPRGSA